MNGTFLAISIPCISALVIFIYNHYKYGRKLTEVLIVLSYLLWISTSIFNSGQKNAFEDAINTTKLSIWKPNTPPIDSLRIINDSVVKAFIISTKNDLENRRQQKVITDSIYNSINSLSNESVSSYKEFNGYNVLIIVILLLCYALSYLFPYIKNKENINKDNNTPKNTLE